MAENDLKSCLKTLVELDLWVRIKSLGEGTEIKDINAERKEVVKRYLENLPLLYKSIDGYQEFVLETLKKLMQKSKKREEER